MASVAVTRRFDLTDGQWALLEPLLPKPKKPGRPPKWSKRQLIDGIRWRVRAGAPWRDVPDCYAHWRSVYGLYRRWQRGGIWARVLSALQGRADAVGLITWDVSVGSTIARAHQHAAGARKRPDLQVEPPGGVAGDEPDDHALGRSRGGWTTKLHVACEQGRKAIRMCADGEVAVGPVTDAVARERYRLTARQLRNIRHAATSGALRRRAGELGVVLPAGYVDLPAGGRINGHKRAGVTS